MKPETVAKLNRLKNRGTRYEIVIETGYERYRLCYAARKSGAGLRDACRNYLDELQESVKGFGYASSSDKAELLMFDPKANTCIIGVWTIKFSGRTQHEAISTETELVWFNSMLDARRTERATEIDEASRAVRAHEAIRRQA